MADAPEPDVASLSLVDDAPSTLLTTETLPAYLAPLLSADAGPLTVVEIPGGNLNYAFRVSDGAADLFVKQTPGFVKVLGPETKLDAARLNVEHQAYREWAAALGEGDPATSSLPDVLHFDGERMVLVLEYLDSYVLLHERLSAGHADAALARRLGEILGAAHAATHCALVPPERAARYTGAFANLELRGLQLEYVFSKAFREAEQAAELREDAAFLGALDALKASYRGEEPANLALCHGDLHAGSVMVDPAGGHVKLIDPEFAVYGPPGLDVGCLVSSYVLAAVQIAASAPPDEQTAGTIWEPVSLTKGVRGVRAAVGALWEAYEEAMAERNVPPALLEATAADAVGFAGCEVARTALGYAGVRGLAVADEKAKAKAVEGAVQLAARCVKARGASGGGSGETAGLAIVMRELHTLAGKLEHSSF